MLRAILATAALTLASCSADPARAAPAHSCKPYADVRLSLGRVVELSPDQRAFLAGVSVVHPKTPEGLPYGDKAAWLVTNDGSALAFFIDGDQACDAFVLPRELVEMTLAIGRGDVLHAGTAN